MNGSLYLFPASPQLSCDAAPLVEALQALAIIAKPMRAHVWHAGEGFARHVIFAGCSPTLRFAPETPDDTQFCHVALHGPESAPRIVSGANTVKPRCPHCRQRIADWANRLQGIAAPCPGCGQTLQAIELDWRQHAALGRVLIEFRNVFPGEASPSDRLLADLQQVSGFDWRYGWAAQLD